MSLRQAIDQLKLLEPEAGEVAEKEYQKLKEESFYYMLDKASKSASTKYWESTKKAMLNEEI